MTPHFSLLANRMERAKKLFLLSIFITVFTLVASVVLGVNYFSVKRKAFQEQRILLAEIQKLDQLGIELRGLQTEVAAESLKGLTPQTIEKIVMARLERWQQISILASDANMPIKALPSLLTPDTTQWDAHLKEITAEKTARFERVDSSIQSADLYHREFIFIGLTVLIFGFLIPYGILKFVVGAVRALRQELEKTAYEVLKTWSEEKANMGEEAFKNVDFWLRLLLLIGHHTGRMSSHPMTQMVGEVAFIVQGELSRLEKERRDRVA